MGSIPDQRSSACHVVCGQKKKKDKKQKDSLKLKMSPPYTETEKVGLKPNIQKTKIMASGHISSLQIHGETLETVTSWAPKSLQMVIAAMKLKDDCSLEEKL